MMGNIGIQVLEGLPNAETVYVHQCAFPTPKTGKPTDISQLSLFARERQSSKIDLIAFSL
jgi:hypothetical protein